MYAAKPHANAKPLDQLPKAGHQDINNTCVGVAPDEGGQTVIVVEVNPAEGPPKGGSAIIEKEDQRQKPQAVNQAVLRKKYGQTAGARAEQAV